MPLLYPEISPPLTSVTTHEYNVVSGTIVVVSGNTPFTGANTNESPSHTVSK